jgi:hypothetical protein
MLVCPWLACSALVCPWFARSALVWLVGLRLSLTRSLVCAPQGLLSDPNMDPYYLGMLVMVGTNKSKFKPPLAAIKERYYAKFRGKGGADLEEPVG